jgi:hypothetical protein
LADLGCADLQRITDSVTLQAQLGLGYSEIVGWALHTSASRLIQDVSIDHRGTHILVPKQLLHRPDIVTISQKMRGK